MLILRVLHLCLNEYDETLSNCWSGIVLKMDGINSPLRIEDIGIFRQEAMRRRMHDYEDPRNAR